LEDEPMLQNEDIVHTAVLHPREIVVLCSTCLATTMNKAKWSQDLAQQIRSTAQNAQSEDPTKNKFLVAGLLTCIQHQSAPHTTTPI
jgi:hypothetical protein